ncbi:MAG: amidohydrolase family protein [Gemmataceae bacterium]
MKPTIVEGILSDIDGVRHGQLVIENGIISQVGTGLGQSDHVFSDDCLIFAGMGDVHIHAREDTTASQNYKETFATAAAAAMNGGVVHVADMPNNPAAPIDDSTYTAKSDLLRQYSLPVLFTLYAGIGPGTKPLSHTVPYKAYMGPSVGDLYFRSLEELEESLSHYPGRAVSFHCEDPILLEKYKGATTHEARRPPECELSATKFALQMIEKYALSGKLCHYSVGEGLTLIREAKERNVPVTAEVTPHHVFFDTSIITDENRPWMQMNPPLRSPADRVAMLEALRDGTADYLATDHAPHTIEEKQQGVSGQPHLDTFGPFATWLLIEQGFSPERIAAICSANPGKFVNPYHSEKYGRLLPEYVGSLTVLNLKKPTKVTRDTLQTRCGWSPFEGMTFPGSVEAVFVRGVRVMA